MATRSTLRVQVRERLKDAGASTLWSDAEISSALEAAAANFGPTFPKETSTTVSLAAAATSTTQPAGAISISSLIAPSGEPIERIDQPAPGRPTPYERLTWRIFAGSIRFSRGLNGSEAGTWTIEYRAPRSMPTSDVTTVDWPDSMLPALVAWAAGSALRTRFVDDAKRGNKTLPNHARITADLQREAENIARGHFRFARGSR